MRTGWKGKPVEDKAMSKTKLSSQVLSRDASGKGFLCAASGEWEDGIWSLDEAGTLLAEGSKGKRRVLSNVTFLGFSVPDLRLTLGSGSRPKQSALQVRLGIPRLLLRVRVELVVEYVHAMKSLELSTDNH